MVLLFLWCFTSYIYRKVTLLKFDALASTDSIHNLWYLGNDGEHQKESYCGENRTVNDAQGWNKEPTDNQRNADNEVEIKHLHSSPPFSIQED